MISEATENASGVVARLDVNALAGDPDRTRQPLVPGPDHRLQRPARPGDQLQLLQVTDGVDLDEVKAVGLEPLQAAVDLGPRLIAVAQAGLGRQDDPKLPTATPPFSGLATPTLRVDAPRASPRRGGGGHEVRGRTKLWRQ